MREYFIIEVCEARIIRFERFDEFGPALELYKELTSTFIVKDPSVDWEAFDEELEIFIGGTDDNCSLQYEDSKGRKHSVTILSRDIEIEEEVDAFVRMMNDHLSLAFTAPNGVVYDIEFGARKKEREV